MSKKDKGQVLPFEAPSYYAILGIKLELDQRSLEPKFPEAREVECAWRKAVVASHPFNLPDEAGSHWDAKFRDVMEAGLTLVDPVDSALYHEHLLSDAGHAGWMRTPDRKPYTVSPLPDWLVLLVGWLQEDAFDIRGEHEDTATAAGLVDVSLVPAYVPGERLAEVAELDVGKLVHQVLNEHGEHFFDLRCLVSENPHAIGWTWRRKTWSHQGATAVGKARKLSDKERARMPGTDAERPVGELQIALSYWLVADQEERARLIFHELCHFSAERGDDGTRKLGVVGHEVETFAKELQVFGLRDQEQAEAFVAALQHPTTPHRLADFGVLPDNQVVMFRRFFAEAEALDGDIAL